VTRLKPLARSPRQRVDSESPWGCVSECCSDRPTVDPIGVAKGQHLVAHPVCAGAGDGEGVSLLDLVGKITRPRTMNAPRSQPKRLPR
jgi:hypothetical protein